MNTTEIKTTNLIKNWNDLFKYAKEQFLMYEKLEGIGDWDKYDFCIDCPKDQTRFKDMLQIRFVEELTEATIAIVEDDEHLKEELTDAMNFFLSAYIMLGIDFKKFGHVLLPAISSFPANGTSVETIRSRTYILVEDVGWLCNLLKNRPWTQSNYLVSQLDFDSRLETLWFDFWDYLGFWGLTQEEVFEMFERKLRVNSFRVETGY